MGSVQFGIVFALGIIAAEQEGLPGADTAITPPRLTRGSFMSNDDYPAEALRLRQEGTSQVALHIGIEGKVINCSVRQSSGSPALDNATCTMFSRLQFRPARNARGQAVESELIQNMTWKLPRRRLRG